MPRKRPPFAPSRSPAVTHYWQALVVSCTGLFFVVIGLVMNSVLQRPATVTSFLLSPSPSSVPLPRHVTVPILLYHYVEVVKDLNDTIRQSFNVQPQTFEQQILTLQQAGYHFLTMGELADLLARGAALPEKSVVLTFDDGYRDFYTDVYPLLQKHQVKATLFVVSDFQNGKNYLTSKQLEELAKSPLVEIGAHTRHHVSLDRQSATTLQREVAGSKTALETQLNMPIRSFAYPYGAYDKAAIEAVKAAGFATAVLATNPDGAERWSIGRIRPGRLTGKHLLDHITREQRSFFFVP